MDFSLHQRAKTGCYSVCTKNTSSGGTVAGSCSFSTASI